jgi:hypothetical protein
MGNAEGVEGEGSEKKRDKQNLVVFCVGWHAPPCCLPLDTPSMLLDMSTAGLDPVCCKLNG